MREAVFRAQEIQKNRFKDLKILFNSQMKKEEIDRFCIMSGQARNTLDRAYEVLHMTARGYYRILKVARTIADLDGEKKINKKHILEAVSYRSKQFE